MIENYCGMLCPGRYKQPGFTLFLYKSIANSIYYNIYIKFII